MPPTNYDYRCFLRTIFVGTCATVLCFVITLSTDFATTSLSSQTARIAVLAPAIGALALLISNTHARARGESQALACIGISPLRASAGSLVAAISIGLLGASFVFVFAPPLTPLFPQLNMPLWSMRAPSVWQNADGVLVSSKGIELVGSGQMPPLHANDKFPIAVLISLLACATPMWLSQSMHVRTRVFMATALILVLIVSFHLVAANMLSAWGLLAAPMLIAIHVIFLWNRSRREGLRL